MRASLMAFLLTALAACNNTSNTNTDSSDTAQSAQTIHTNARDTVVTNKTPVVLNGCYQLVLKRDTATMQLTMRDSTITGTLQNRNYEKDKNSGTLKGVLRGDTILADYTFQSEGMTSVREVAFKMAGDSLLQGFGPVVEQNNKAVFQDRSKLQFEPTNTFRKVPCR